jgi:hypothetical protein
MDLRAVRGMGFFGFFDFGDFLEFVEGLEGIFFFELNMVFVGGFAIGGFFEKILKVLSFEGKVFDFLFFGHEESFG